MKYTNPVMVEFMVPRDPEVGARMRGFYEDIGWRVRNDTSSDFFTYVTPEISGGTPPTIAYWQTTNVGKTALFLYNESNTPSSYANGLQLPRLQELIEVCLVVPFDDDVQSIFEQGGELLKAHTHIAPRTHAGKQEFRFSDPFNYSLRVTANPDWEITPPVVYDSAFVTLVLREDSEATLPVITKADLQEFATVKLGNAALGVRAYNALHRYAQEQATPSPYWEYVAANPGLRPDKLKRLLTLMHEDKEVKRIVNFGTSSMNLLQQLCDEIFPEETSK